MFRSSSFLYNTLVLSFLLASLSASSRLHEATVNEVSVEEEDQILNYFSLEVLPDTLQNLFSEADAMDMSFFEDLTELELQDIFTSHFPDEGSQDYSRPCMRGKVGYFLRPKRLEIYAKLLELYRQQVDHTSRKILWEKVKIFNYPIDSDKTNYKQWTRDDLIKLEQGLANIRFERLPDNTKTAEPNRKRLCRTKAIHACLLERYRAEIDSSAKFVSWKKARAINFPPELIHKPGCNWTNVDLDLLESLLPSIYFEKIRKIEQEVIDESISSNPSRKRNSDSDSTPNPIKRMRASKSDLVPVESEESLDEPANGNISIVPLTGTAISDYLKMRSRPEKYRFLNSIFLEMYRKALSSSSGHVRWNQVEVSGWPEGLKIAGLKVYKVEELDILYQHLPNISFKAKPANSRPLGNELYDELWSALQRFPAALYHGGINWKAILEQVPELKLKSTRPSHWNQQNCDQIREFILNGLIPRLEAQSKNSQK